jgi:hypothetical protein
MGQLPRAPFELRLAVTLFLLLLGVADLFGAWQVANFASFSPAGVARAVAPPGGGHPALPAGGAGGERPVSLADLDREGHHIARELLVQDTHVHVPVYALTAAALALVVCGLDLRSRVRSLLVWLAFAAPAADFAGLWGAHLFPAGGAAWGTLAVAGGLAMGLAYTAVLVVTLRQCWLSNPHKENSHA